MDATSGPVTIDVGSVARSLDALGYTNTLTHNAAATLTLGDATAGAGSRALRFVAGMTYTLGDAITSAITFISTSAVVQAVDFAGKTTGSVLYNGVGGSWQLTGVHNTGTLTPVTVTRGTFDTNGQTVTWGMFNFNNANTKTITLGASAITVTTVGTAWLGIATGTTLNANTSVINVTGTSATFNGGVLTYNSVRLTGSFFQGVAGGSTFGSFERTGTASTSHLVVYSNFTVTGTLTLAGSGLTNRLLVRSDVQGTTRTITNAGATMTWSYVDFQDIALGTLFDASAITGLSGDAGGNSNITFTAAQPQFWIGDTGNWSDATQWSISSGGAANGRRPLPQDDATFDNNSFSGAGQIVSMDVVRVGRTMDWSAYTEGQNPTLVMNSNVTTYGSWTLIAGMTLTGPVGSVTFEGRGAFTLTSAGKTLPVSYVAFQQFGGTMTLQDAFSQTGTMFILNGTFNANNFNVTAFVISITGTFVRTVTMGSGTWTASSTGTAWNATTTTNLTFNSNISTILFTDVSASTKTFQGGGLTYYFFNITGGGTGAVITTGSNTFANLPQISGGTKTLQYTAGTTQTYTGGIGYGNGTNIITINTTTAAQHNLSMASGIVSADYLNLTNSNATGGATWYAGANSVDNGGNTGWIFTAAPGGGPGSSGMLLLMGVGT